VIIVISVISSYSRVAQLLINNLARSLAFHLFFLTSQKFRIKQTQSQTLHPRLSNETMPSASAKELHQALETRLDADPEAEYEIETAKSSRSKCRGISPPTYNLGCNKTIAEGEYRLKHGKNKASYYKVLGFSANQVASSVCDLGHFGQHCSHPWKGR
jgi:hypothetical protein